MNCCSTARDEQVANVDTLGIVSPGTYDYESFKTEIIKPYLDTLESYRVGSKLPAFLFNTDLDFNSEINNWPNSNYVSLREEIFRRVTNIEVLEAITSESFFRHQFDSVVNRDAIPSDRFSNTYLAIERLKDLTER